MVFFQFLLHFNPKILVLSCLDLGGNLFNFLLNFIVLFHFLLPFLILRKSLNNSSFLGFTHLLLVFLRNKSVPLIFLFLLTKNFGIGSLRCLSRNSLGFDLIIDNFCSFRLNLFILFH